MDPEVGRDMTRVSDLRGREVRSSDGKSLGHVHEVHADKGLVVALMCGPGSLIERWTARASGRRIPWDQVCWFVGVVFVFALFVVFFFAFFLFWFFLCLFFFFVCCFSTQHLL